MASPGDRFKQWVESLSEAWKDRLKGWASGVIGFGIEVFMDVLAKSAAPKLKPIIDIMEKTGKVPPELKPLLDEIKNPTGEVAAALGLHASNPLIGGAVGRIADAILLPMSYAVNSVTRNVILAPQLLLSAELRGLITKEQADEYISWLGYTQADIDIWRNLVHVILPSEVVGPVYLRDRAKWQKFWDELPKLGLSKEQVELLQESLYKYPTAEQAITWMAHEVFEEDMAAKYGLDDEADKLDWAFLEKIGINRDIGGKHWRSHWQHASWTQILVMLHRGLITEQDVYDWFRLVEIPPYWRDNLTKTMYDLPGRIEVRMMAQLGLIDKAFIVDILRKNGLAEEYLDVVADMNLVRGIRTDIQARYTKGWLDSDGVKTELAAAGLSANIADRLYQWIVSNAKPERTTAEKDLTKAEIVKSVKLGELTWGDGVALLMKMGYDEDEAGLILAIGIPVAAEELTDVQKIQIDTIRRKRRKQFITQSAEIQQLQYVGISPELARAYADNDEMRLGRVPGEEAA